MAMTKIASPEPSVGTTNIAPGKVGVRKANPTTKLSTSKLCNKKVTKKG